MFMAKELAKENPVMDALRRLKEEEAELMVKLKPIQEAIAALEKIVDKSGKKVKATGKDQVEQTEEQPELIAEAS